MADLKVKYVYQAVTDKVEKYREMIQQLGLVPEETLYIGDDVIDLPLLGSVGISVAVADAHPLLLGQVDIVTKNIGGSGAVREITDIVLQAQGKLSIIEGSI
jgi:3-deoxy-D-manno-octulosonate 8-phosphate phosphatase (KDO 8-P phosphatase)